MKQGIEMTTSARNLRRGDFVTKADATVVDVDVFAGLAIVDFDDNTATPPIDANTAVTIVRPE